ncbi:Piwi domain-containing protein [Kaistella faecalis]|uniref:Piwi domain-containing protein n=1 Tax=Kaistella faecalis TaxID=2852098 RepID=UPI001C46FB03|nr:Piwi domain-containing protein [Chryseobacterium faecale]UFK97708.1 hypothetical protein LL667_12215 [Chryseobacterium faecale]
MNQNLHFNILTFKLPTEQLTFYFTNEDADGLVRYHIKAVPDEVVGYFGEQEHYYTSFTEEKDGFIPVTKKTVPDRTAERTKDGTEIFRNVHNSAFTLSVLKAYYSAEIAKYFNSRGFPVMPNFIKAIEVWLPADTKDAAGKYKLYRKFSLKVQKSLVSDDWELMVVFEGVSKVFQKSLTELQDLIPSKALNWVIHENSLYRFANIPVSVRRNLDTVYPVWNFDIRSAIHERPAAPERGNKYRKFKEEIEKLYNEHLNTEEFREIITIGSKGFYKVPDKLIGMVSSGSNKMVFGNNEKDINPTSGLTNHGPFDVSDAAVIEFFYIFHEDNTDAVTKLHRYFQGKINTFKGLDKFILTPYAFDKNLKITFKNKNNPWPEVSASLRDLKTSKDIRYVAIYVSPFTKEEATPEQKKVYYHIKERLLHLGILSQVIDAQKTMNNRLFEYSALNMAIAILAKLDGIPWQLNTDLRKELIVGVGAFRNTESNVKYIASAFSFNNTGQFNCFDHFYENQTKELAGSIIHKVKEYTSIDPTLKRLIIHFYKSISEKEIAPIEEGLKNLGIHIPVYIVSINKTESTDVTAFDNSDPVLMPFSGTYINVGYRKYILFNNTRYSDGYFKASNGYPFPIKLELFCTEKHLLNDTRTVKELIEQVYQFSRMYWKSVKQQNLPVTIKYSQMVAEMLPHFQGTTIPEFGKDKLWFL